MFLCIPIVKIPGIDSTLFKKAAVTWTVDIIKPVTPGELSQNNVSQTN